MAAGEIVVSLLMKTASFETDTARAGKSLRQLQKDAEASSRAFKASFAGNLLSDLVQNLGRDLAQLPGKVLGAFDAMSKLAQQTGVSVESFSALSYAANLAGVNQEKLSSAIVKLSKNMSDASQGISEAGKGFDALGISVKNANGTLKSSDQVLSEVAAKFAGYKGGAEKTALAVNIFGKAGAKLIPLLNGGADGLARLKEEAERFGVVIDTQAAKAAEEFNDNLTKLKAASEGARNQLVS